MIENNPWNLIRLTPAEGARRQPRSPSTPCAVPDRPAAAPDAPDLLHAQPGALDGAASAAVDFAAAFPGSRKVYVTGECAGHDCRADARDRARGRRDAARVRHERTAGLRRPAGAAAAPRRVDHGARRRGRGDAVVSPGPEGPTSGAAVVAVAARAARQRERSRSCTTRGAARSRRRWSSSPCARASTPSSCAARSRAAAPSSPPTSTTPSSSR